MRAARVRACLAALTMVITACGGSGSAPPAGARPSGAPSARASATSPGPGSPEAAGAAVPDGDWTRFAYDAVRSGVGPASTGITAGNLRRLRRRRVPLNGTIDSSPIQLHAIRVGGRPHDLIIVTTTYGRTLAIDAGTGRRMWEFVPSGIGHYEGSARITNTSPVADPSRRYVFAASPDGLIHKLNVANGRQVRSRHWPVHVTLDPTHEKLASALNLSGREVIVTTDGYVGDAPPYQGHVVTIDRSSGRILRVWNSLCSDRHRLIVPRTCPISDSAIWGRAGAVVEPGSGRLLVTTGNADTSVTQPFDGRRFWSDSVLELTPDASRLLQNWTPRDQVSLSTTDTDLGSTSPAILPPYAGRRLAVQGGKDGLLHLLDLNRLNGTARAGARLGGELQNIPTPAGGELFTAPAVARRGGRILVFVADFSGTGVYVLTGPRARPRLRLVARNASAGTSPVLAGGLLYVFDPNQGVVRVYEPAGLRQLAALPAATGHWNSPIALGGRLVVPEGNANDHAVRGTLDIFHLPGR